MILFKLLSKGVVEEICGCVSTGKEVNDLDTVFCPLDCKICPMYRQTCTMPLQGEMVDQKTVQSRY